MRPSLRRTGRKGDSEGLAAIPVVVYFGGVSAAQVVFAHEALRDAGSAPHDPIGGVDGEQVEVSNRAGVVVTVWILLGEVRIATEPYRQRLAFVMIGFEPGLVIEDLGEQPLHPIVG